jgi:hypothetical protein
MPRPVTPTPVKVSPDSGKEKGSGTIGSSSTDWVYDANANAIVFGTAPTNGQEIEARYPVTEQCAAE